MKQTKKPENYTLAEIIKISDKQFPPPWGIIEAVGRLKIYIESYHKKNSTGA